MHGEPVPGSSAHCALSDLESPPPARPLPTRLPRIPLPGIIAPLPADFFQQPILNSPYERPGRHWELDDSGQPTGREVGSRRPARFVSPIPQPKKRSKAAVQAALDLGDDAGLSTAEQRYGEAMINELRERVEAWRQLQSPAHWQVTPETARLLQHWRHHPFSGIRPFFCQLEAVETVIWLTEVAPQAGTQGKPYLDHLAKSNQEANPELLRLALKLATGAGKTTVMAMLIAWQTVNAVRRPKFHRAAADSVPCQPGRPVRRDALN
jgi:type III restriction enzyme